MSENPAMAGSIRSFPLRAFMLALMQTCCHMPEHTNAHTRGGERAGGLFADQIRSRAPSHNNLGFLQISWWCEAAHRVLCARGFLFSATLTHSCICLGHHLYSFLLHLWQSATPAQQNRINFLNSRTRSSLNVCVHLTQTSQAGWFHITVLSNFKNYHKRL